MKIVLISISLKNKKVEIKKKKILGIEFVFLKLDKGTINKLSRKLYYKLFKIYLRKVVLKEEKSIFILSKDTRNFSLDKYFDFGFKDFFSKNYIRENSIKYLKDINNANKVLIITNEIDKTLLEKYIEIFKEVNIYTDNTIKFTNLASRLEREYGAVVNIYDHNSNMYINVDIAVYLDDIHINGKVISKKNYFLTENTLDRYSKEYEIYLRYKDMIPESISYPERKLALAISYLHNFN